MPGLRLLPLAAILLAIGPSPAWAGSTDNTPAIRVSADDRGSVSRVAFNFMPKAGFRVEQSVRDVTVIFPDSALRFAYDEVYPRREASRVLFAGPVARPGAAAFNLRFACDCETSVALDDSQRVLVEIRDRGAAAPPTEQAPGDQTAKVTADTSPPLPRRRPANRKTSDDMASAPATEMAASEPPEPASPAGDGGLAAHELERLRASLEWAATQGFMNVTPAPATAEGPTARQPAASAGNESSPNDIAELPPTDSPAQPPEPGAAETKISADAQNRPSANRPPNQMAAAEVERCTVSTEQPAIDWSSVVSDDSNYLAALGHRRAATIGQAGPDALRDMALFYLAHGLNREAIATVLAISPPPGILRDAALILIGRGGEAGDALLDAAACRPDAPVWEAALLRARGKTAMAAQAAAKAAEALRSFPKHPRTVLALDLADAALADANTALAGRLLDLVDPAAGQSVADMVNLLRGRIALAEGHDDRADWYFDQAMTGTSKARRQAQFALIRHALATGGKPPSWAGDVLRSALFDHRGEPDLLPIVEMAAALHAAMGNFGMALADLSATMPRLPQTMDADPLQAKARAILEQALMQPDRIDDASALQLFRDHGHFLEADESSATVRIPLARRMLAAGLPSAAEAILAPLAGPAGPPPAVLLPLAEAALRTNRPDDALALLSRAEVPGGAEFASLKRRALIRLGRFDEAAAIAERAGLQGVSARLNWAAADWAGSARNYAALLSTMPAEPAALESKGKPALRALAAAYMGDGPPLPPPLRVKAMQMAEAAGLADAAAALTAPPLPAGLTLPDAVAAVVERSRQVRALFPPQHPSPSQ